MKSRARTETIKEQLRTLEMLERNQNGTALFLKLEAIICRRLLEPISCQGRQFDRSSYKHCDFTQMFAATGSKRLPRDCKNARFCLSPNWTATKLEAIICRKCEFEETACRKYKSSLGGIAWRQIEPTSTLAHALYAVRKAW